MITNYLKSTLLLTLFSTFISQAQTINVSLMGTANDTNISANSFDGGTDDAIFERDGFQFFGDDNNDGMPSNSQIQYHTSAGYLVGSTGGFYNYLNINTPSTRFVIKKTDGAEFDFQSVVVVEFVSLFSNIIFEAYKDGNYTGSQTINITPYDDTTVNLDSTFDDVDEVRIHNSDGFGEYFAYDNFVFTLNTLHVDEFGSAQTLSVYPNPTSDFLEISELTKIENYRIFDVLGAEVNNGTISKNKQINIRDLSNGMYFLKINNGKSIKFIKK